MLLPDPLDDVVPVWMPVVAVACPLDVGPIELWDDRVEVAVMIPFWQFEAI